MAISSRQGHDSSEGHGVSYVSVDMGPVHLGGLLPGDSSGHLVAFPVSMHIFPLPIRKT